MRGNYGEKEIYLYMLWDKTQFVLNTEKLNNHRSCFDHIEYFNLTFYVNGNIIQFNIKHSILNKLYYIYLFYLII